MGWKPPPFYNNYQQKRAFCTIIKKGKVHVKIVTNVKAKKLLTGTIKKVKKESIMYTDKWKGYDSLMFHGYRYLSVNHSKMFGKGYMYINSIEVF